MRDEKLEHVYESILNEGLFGKKDQNTPRDAYHGDIQTQENTPEQQSAIGNQTLGKNKGKAFSLFARLKNVLETKNTQENDGFWLHLNPHLMSQLETIVSEIENIG